MFRVPALGVPRISSLPVGVPSPRLTSAMAAFRPDVVHLASPFVLGAGGLVSATLLDVPTVAVFQTDIAGFAASYGLGRSAGAAWQWTRWLHNEADRTLAPSEWAARALTGHGIQRVHRWGRGVATARFAPARRSATLRAGWGTGDRLVVGYVGRLAPEKRVHRLAALQDVPGVRLVIVGDGPERAALSALLPRATFTGQLEGDALAAAVASLDVMVHPGEHETFCQSVQEALAAGVPVVVSDRGGQAELVTHGRSGYVVDADRFELELRAAVQTLRDQGVRARFGLAARESVLGRTWPTVCAELVDHYEAVCAERSVPAR